MRHADGWALADARPFRRERDLCCRKAFVVDAPALASESECRFVGRVAHWFPWGRAGTLDWALSDFAAMAGGAAGGRASESLRQPASVAARPFVAGFPV